MNFEERLLYVTRNLVSYHEYGQDVLKASKVVRKHFPKKSLDECKNSLEMAVRIYQAGIEFVAANKDAYWKSKEGPQSGLTENENAFCREYPTFPKGLLMAMLYGIFNWYHER